MLSFYFLRIFCYKPFDTVQLVSRGYGFILFYVPIKSLLYVFINFVKKHSLLFCNSLTDIVISDSANRILRFSCFYIFYSIYLNLRLKLFIPFKNNLFSLVNIFKSSIWFEREIWDMFGINFLFNYDQRRILSDYGFLGFPLRKDFPVSGLNELVYNKKKNSINYKWGLFAQELRSITAGRYFFWNINNELTFYFVRIGQVAYVLDELLTPEFLDLGYARFSSYANNLQFFWRFQLQFLY